MPTLPKPEDVQKMRDQAAHAFGGAVEHARQPLLAALGAGDLAAHAVIDTLTRIRTELGDRAESARADLPTDFNELREQLDPAELRKRVDAYTQSAVKLYDYLAERGEGALERLQPQVQQARKQAESAQGRVEEVVGEVRVLADDVLGKVTRGARSYGEKAARQTEQAADDAAETVQDAGAKAASATRSTARKAAAKTEAAKTGESEKSGSAAKATTAGKSSAKSTPGAAKTAGGKAAGTKGTTAKSTSGESES
ncbi:hypothetical protein HUO13_35180 [Saccharopolyspora erythraea]|uniref:hypothetical protein n=1 Tax=Saccharopolyspora erythraea TaxID=1836 RepID=UPI001BA4676F|nr:hypothetical protein [Saccharopolyspora erythraea]QUH05329.1 hypothetical protein HUO13_35180 [Saccharopolyspora erythraea]